MNITVPEDHIVASTGELQNADAVLTADQLERWEKSKTADDPVLIVTKKKQRKLKKAKQKELKPGRITQKMFVILHSVLPVNLFGMQWVLK